MPNAKDKLRKRKANGLQSASHAPTNQLTGTLHLERVHVSQLNPAVYNPRVMSTEARNGLRASLKTFSYVEPIIWNKRTGNIVGGHQRYNLLVEDGVQEVDVVVVDLDDVHEKVLNVTLNNAQLTGRFDNGSLDAVLQSLQNIAYIPIDDLRLNIAFNEFNVLKTPDDLAPVIEDRAQELEHTTASKMQYAAKENTLVTPAESPNQLSVNTTTDASQRVNGIVNVCPKCQHVF